MRNINDSTTVKYLVTDAPTAATHPARPLHQRVCFRLQVRPDRLEEYRMAHARVWPDMLRALQESGWHEYSLFLAEDGLLIGYFETDSLASAIESMQERDVNQRWQEAMSGYFLDIDTTPDQGFVQLTEVFNLDDQLAAIDLDDAQSTTQGKHST